MDMRACGGASAITASAASAVPSARRYSLLGTSASSGLRFAPLEGGTDSAGVNMRRSGAHWRSARLAGARENQLRSFFLISTTKLTLLGWAEGLGV
eukprot:scaffold10373_cov118-Isochrysis_galbana.AAC.7